MAVKIGSARIDENGHAMGGKPGDQTGKEVSTQNWYLHSKGWRVFRAKSPEAAERIAQAMQAACDNPRIGYDQGDRGTLYSVAKPLGFDISKVTTPCETDCSALVRVCCAYAGITLPNFRTPTEAAALLDSSAFTELTGSKYTESADCLKRGDILVTKKQGHTVVVLTNGGKAGADVAPGHYALGDRILKNGDAGDDVRALQEALIRLGFNLGRWGADGDFGDATEMAVKLFQSREKLEADGEFGPLSLTALKKALAALEIPEGEMARRVCITGGACYVRKGPGTEYGILGAVVDGTLLPYGGETSEAGWLLVEYNNVNGWVSGKYGRLIE